MPSTFGNMTNRVFQIAMRPASASAVAQAFLSCMLFDTVATQRDCESQNRAERAGIVFG